SSLTAHAPPRLEIPSSCRRGRLDPGCPAQVFYAPQSKSHASLPGRGAARVMPVTCGPQAWRARATVPATASLRLRECHMALPLYLLGIAAAAVRKPTVAYYTRYFSYLQSGHVPPSCG